MTQMTQIKVFPVIGPGDEAELNRFLGEVNVTDIIYMGTHTPPGGCETPQVMVVYEDIRWEVLK